MFTVLPLDIHNVIVSLLDKPSLLMLSFTNSYFKPFGKRVNVKEIAKYGYLNIMKYIKFEMNEKVFASAAKSNNLELLKWLKESGCPSNSKTWYNAAGYCDINILQWLCDNELPYNEDSFTFAAGHNTVKVLEWLSNNVTYDKGTDCMVYAVSNNKLENVKWLYDNGFNNGDFLIKYACIVGNIEMLDYLYEKNLTSRDEEKEYLFAKINGHSHVTRWLDTHH